jgi:deoxyadenosine/deoxycytidine kinase
MSSDVTVVSEPDLRSIQRLARSGAWHDTQRAIVRHRAHELSRVRTPLAIMDRHFSEDRDIFFRLHLALRHLTQPEYEALVDEVTMLEEHFPSPFRIIYVNAPRNVLLARMHRQRQPNWLTDNLDLQLRLYSEWLEARATEHLVVNTAHQQTEVLAQSAWEWILSG